MAARRPTFSDAVAVLFATIVVGALVVANLRPYRTYTLDDTRAQLAFLRSALDRGAAADMQRMFPEGFVFTWVLYGLANARVHAQMEPDDAGRDAYIAEAIRAVRTVRSDRARRTFVERQHPRYGAFYTSWTLYGLAETLRAMAEAREAGAPDPAALPELSALFVEEADSFAAALASAATPFPPSYPGAAWPADAAVGVAALGIHDGMGPPRYADVVGRWVEQVRVRLDGDLGAISHGADPESGAPWGGVRGSSLALMSRVLVDADPDFAREQYRILRDHFVERRLGFPGVREYPAGTDGAADVDSGPLLLGFSGPAVVVGEAAARAHGDRDLATALRGSLEVVGVPVEIGGTRRYGLGLVPIGDAFIAWAGSTPGRSSLDAGTWRPLVPRRWSVPMHLVSVVLAALVLTRLYFVLRKGGGPGPQLAAQTSASGWKSSHDT